MANYVQTLDHAAQGLLYDELKKRGFSFSKPAHTLFAAKGDGISVTLYTSGKMVVAGRNKEEFIRYFLEPEVLQSFTYDYPDDYPKESPTSAHIGVDESGKGDFFGPLVVSAAYADQEAIQTLTKKGVRDSKTLNGKKIFSLNADIQKCCVVHTLVVGPKKYNELYARFQNLNSLLAWGHATAIQEVMSKTSCNEVVVDQFAASHVVEQALARKGLSPHLSQRPRAEEDVVVAAASIAARATFLRKMEELSRQAGIPLPRGGGARVTAAAKQLVHSQGKEILLTLAKCHFANYRRAVG